MSSLICAQINCNIGYLSTQAAERADDIYRLLIAFANGLNPGQDQHDVPPDLDPKCLTF